MQSKYKVIKIRIASKKENPLLLDTPDLDEHSQYLGMVKIIENMTQSNLISDLNYSYKNVPKLSETWFCCAEPSQIQLDRIKTNTALI